MTEHIDDAVIAASSLHHMLIACSVLRRHDMRKQSNLYFEQAGSDLHRVANLMGYRLEKIEEDQS